jgi:hypothetical protein
VDRAVAWQGLGMWYPVCGMNIPNGIGYEGVWGASSDDQTTGSTGVNFLVGEERMLPPSSELASL